MWERPMASDQTIEFAGALCIGSHWMASIIIHSQDRPWFLLWYMSKGWGFAKHRSSLRCWSSGIRSLSDQTVRALRGQMNTARSMLLCHEIHVFTECSSHCWRLVCEIDPMSEHNGALKYISNYICELPFATRLWWAIKSPCMWQIRVNVW